MLTLFLLRDDIKIRILDCFIRILAFIFLLSLFEHIVYFISGFRIVVGRLVEAQGVVPRPVTQTLFNFYLADSIRFQSFAEEPGGVGTICSFLLFATSGCRKYRKQYIIFWLAGIFSFSLAFFLLAAIHLAFVTTNRRNRGTIMIVLLTAIVFYFVFPSLVDELILDRLSGGIDDNRSSGTLLAAFVSSWLDGSLWWGTPASSITNDYIVVGNAGATLMVYLYGIIRVGLLIIAYVLGYLINLKNTHLQSKTFAIVFLIVFWISFYQRQYVLFFSYILIYFVMPAFLSYKEQLNGLDKQKFFQNK